MMGRGEGGGVGFLKKVGSWGLLVINLWDLNWGVCPMST